MKDLNHSTATSGLAIPVYQSRHFDRRSTPVNGYRQTARHVWLVLFPDSEIAKIRCLVLENGRIASRTNPRAAAPCDRMLSQWNAPRFLSHLCCSPLRLLPTRIASFPSAWMAQYRSFRRPIKQRACTLPSLRAMQGPCSNWTFYPLVGRPALNHAS